LLAIESLIENTFQGDLNNNNDQAKIDEIENLIRFYNRNNIGLLNAALTPIILINDHQ